MTIASLIVDVAANTIKLTKDVDAINDKLGSIGKIAGAVGKAIAAAFTVTAIVGAAKQVIDFASHLTDLSQRTGISTTGLQKLQLAFEQSGIGIDTVTAATGKLAKNVYGGDKSTVAVLEKLGVSVSSLKKMAPEDQFLAVADAIGKIPNPSEKAYAAVTVFGKGGAELLAGLNGHLKETTDKFAAMGIIIDEKTVTAADDFGDQMTVLQKVGMAFLARVLAPLLPGLATLAEWLMNVGTGAIQLAQDVEDWLIKAWMQAGITFDKFLLSVAEGSQKIPILGKYLGASADTVRSLRQNVTDGELALKLFSTSTDKVAESAKKATPPLVGLGEMPDGPLKSLLHNIDEMVAKLTPLPGHFVLVSTQVRAFGSEAAKLVLEADAMGVKVPASVRAIADAVNASEIDKLMGEVTAKWLKDLDEFNKKGEDKISALAKNMADAILGNDAAMRGAIEEAGRMLQERTSTQYEFQLAELERWVRAEKLKVDTHAANWRQAYDAIEQDANERLQAIAGAESVSRMAAATKAAGEAAERGFVAGFTSIVQDVPSLISQAFTGGGGISGALSAVTSKVGASLGQKLFTGVFGEKLVDGVGSLFGNKIGQALAGSMGPIGSAIGALAPVIFSGLKKLFGGVSQAELQGRQAIGDFEKSLASTLSATQKAEAGGTQWKMTTIAVRDAYLATGRSAADAEAAVKKLWDSSKLGADATKAAIDEINAVMDQQKQDAADLDAAIQKYGFSIDELGPKMQKQKLDEQAQQLTRDFTLLVGSGIDMNVVVGKMSDALNEYLHTAMRTGVEVPSAMKPIIDKMIETGQLTDENGNKITDLADAHLAFTETMSQGFDRLIKKLDELFGHTKEGVDELAAGTQRVREELDKLPTERHIKVVSDMPDAGSPGYAAVGGYVGRYGMQYLAGGGNVLPFVPRGTDVVPAMLTPGEGVVNRSGMGILGRDGLRALNGGRRGGQVAAGDTVVTTNLVVDGQVVARMVERHQDARVRRRKKLDAA